MGLKKHDEASKLVATNGQGKGDLAMVLEMEDELGLCPGPEEFATTPREFPRT